jgi:hypothetical protein
MKKKATIKMKGMRIVLTSRAPLKSSTPIYYPTISRELYLASRPNIFCPAEVPRITKDSPVRIYAGTKRWACNQRCHTCSWTRFKPTSTNMMRFLRPKKLKLERYLPWPDKALWEGIGCCDSCLSYWDPPWKCFYLDSKPEIWTLVGEI